MNRSNTTIPRLALAASALLTAGAGADIISNWASPSLHTVEVTGMPDLDQRREWDDMGTPGYFGDDILGLPNGGSMWCAPTSVMNLFIYAANHGFPGLAPGPGSWSEWTDYNAATINLMLMGTLMGTDGVDGTGGGVADGMVAWIETSGDAGDFLVLSMRRDGSDFPLASEVAGLVRLGGVASFCYGRYNQAPWADGTPLVVRDGGHCITFTKYARNGSSQVIKYRDPATDSQFKTWQSGWQTKSATVTDISVWPGTPFGSKATVSALNYPSDDGMIRILDSTYVLLPRFGLSYTNDPQAATVKTRSTFPISWPKSGTPQGDVELLVGGAMQGWAPMPFEAKAWALIASGEGQPALLHETDYLTGDSTPLPMAPPGLTQLAAGRLGDLYATDGTSLFRLATDGSVVGQVALSGIDALAYDDASDEVLALRNQAHAIHRLQRDLGGPATIVPVPTPVPMSGEADLVADPNEPGRMWFITSAHDSIFGVKFAAPIVDLDVIELPAVQSPTALEVDERGRLYAVCGGLVVAISNLPGLGWQVDANAVMHGEEVGEGFFVGRSRMNYGAADMPFPEWRNLEHDLLMDAPEEADCLGDLNFDGVVDGADVGQMLSLWGGEGPADLDASGLIDGTDLGILLSAWGECPE